MLLIPLVKSRSIMIIIVRIITITINTYQPIACFSGWMRIIQVFKLNVPKTRPCHELTWDPTLTPTQTP